MSPTFHFFDVHAWYYLYFFVIPSREPRLSYLSLLSAIWYLSPPKPQNVANFCFSRCTYLVIFTRLWDTTARSYHLDMTQLSAPYSSCILEFALLYHSLHVSTSLLPDEGPKAIPSTNWVPSRVLFSDVNFSRKHDFQLRFCSQCVVQPSPKSKRMNKMRVQTVMMIQIYQGNRLHCYSLFTFVSPLPFLSYRIKKLHASGWTNASPMTFMAHRPQKDHHYP